MAKIRVDPVQPVKAAKKKDDLTSSYHGGLDVHVVVEVDPETQDVKAEYIPDAKDAQAEVDILRYCKGKTAFWFTFLPTLVDLIPDLYLYTVVDQDGVGRGLYRTKELATKAKTWLTKLEGGRFTLLKVEFAE